MDNSSQLLKIKEVADLLGVTRRTVYRRIWAGELSATKIGGLYYIRQADITAMMKPVEKRGPEPGGLRVGEKQGLLKCGACLRLIRSSDQIAGHCGEEGCEALICNDCAGRSKLRCRRHVVSDLGKWVDARTAFEAGELTTLVRSNQARLREINYLNRIRGRVAQIKTLVHPQTHQMITVENWEALLQRDDERAEVLRLKGKVLLDTKDLAEMPMNAWLLYQIPAKKGQNEAPLDLVVKVLSRLDVMVEDGFDTQALTADELSAYMLQFNEIMEQEQRFRLLVLSSTTGWDDGARQIIAGKGKQGGGSAFTHPMLLIYLYDLETNELIYYTADERLAQYADLFTPLLLSEEAAEAEIAIENELFERGHGSLTLQDANKILPYSERVLRQAFDHMANSGRYRLLELADLGIAIQQK